MVFRGALNDTDTQLLALLRDDARMSLTTLAPKLRVSRGTVQNRLAKLEALRGQPGVHTLHSTNGRWDFMAELRADNLEGLDRVLGRVRRIDGVANTETSILLSTHKL